MRTMSNSSTVPRSASPGAEASPPRLNVRAMRCECQHCHTHTFLVLRTIGEAQCIVCQSFDLAPIED
jgi:hypothetical protein